MMRRITSGIFLAVVFITGCTKQPSTPEYWESRLSNAKNSRTKEKAIEALRNSKHLGPIMLPMLHEQLKASSSPRVQTSLARLLGEMKDASSVDPLVQSINLKASGSSARRLNQEIATALGSIGDQKAVPALAKFLNIKGDQYTVIAAIGALGVLRAEEAFDPLYELATDKAIEPYITKRAIKALGEIGDERAVPGIVKAMFIERKGISFYVESSFALYQLGKPAADALLRIVEKKDEALHEWAKKRGVTDIALFAKSIQVLGDVHDMRAEKAIVGFLNFRSNFYDIMLIIRMRAADALGRMRSKLAIAPLTSMLTVAEPNARKEYVWALCRIGSEAPLKALIQSARMGGWDAREESIKGVAMLGSDAKVFDAFVKNEPSLFSNECKRDPNYFGCKDIAASVKKHIAQIQAYKLRARAAATCQGDISCWVQKLDDEHAGVRERAAYEIGRSGQGELLGELMKRLTEKNLDARLAFTQGADWLIHDSKEAQAEAHKFVPALEKQLASERGKTAFVKVNEDLRRLHVKARRKAE